MTTCKIIGITDSRKQWFTPEVTKIIAEGTVFSGGKRHHEIIHDLLPENAVWIDITVPLSDVFQRYRDYDDIVVFASGDPLFFGFANTVLRECPDVEMRVYPSFNSLQMLAHRLNMPYQDMHVVSLTGRPWDKFDEALISGEKLIGCLTDRHNTPQAIMQRMTDYGYDNYTVFIGENLGNEEKERITEVALPPRPNLPLTDTLNCVIIRKTSDRLRPFGIPESEFHLLNGRTKMITKMPVRLLSLSFLDLHNRKTLWDIGFCTGSVSIEAKLQFPSLSVTSFEIREEGRRLMELNSKKFGSPGITTVIGDFLTVDINHYRRPDAVFIGGHGGRLKQILQKVHEVLLPEGCIVFNSVSEESRQMFEEGIAEVGMKITQRTHIATDNFNPIYILKAQ